MMAMVKNMIAKKKESELSSEDKAFIETYGENVDFMDRATIGPLVNYVRVHHIPVTNLSSNSSAVLKDLRPYPIRK